MRLHNQKLITIERKKYKNENSETIRKNYYHFNLNPENYFFVLNNFLKSNLEREIKGFLLILKAICFNNTNTYSSTRRIKGGLNKSELSRLIGMNIKTIEKYLDISEKLDEIEIIDNQIVIKNNCFPLRVKEHGSKLENRKTEIINTIQEICNKYNAIMPLVSGEVLDRILLYYPLLEDSIERTNDNNLIKQCSFRYILNERLKKSLPKQFNTEYILKVLNISKPEKKEITNYKFILD
ncbi:hypothetical protein [Dysgonomonas sp. 520]|uniref:hypothetical protein n=1 Tax=Dysgonomonas sp. 520 TaxID=2302931 RepID=UPI0013D033A3|nr:hypothetical protein [Dysgonomonas sp. 520]NDW09613.1 hypothetical protein [Dysgonomonas sp. 520]